MDHDDKKNTVIASEQYLVRLGIKTLLNVIGVESDLHEVNSKEELDAFIADGQKINYLILSDDLFSKHGFIDNNQLKNVSHLCKTLFFCRQKNSLCNCNHFILHSNNRKQVVEKLEQFFFEPVALSSDKDSCTLSDREIDVLKAVALGFSNKEIADQLFISINTVITHRKNITGKLGIKTISGLTVYALMHQMVKAEEVM